MVEFRPKEELNCVIYAYQIQNFLIPAKKLNHVFLSAQWVLCEFSIFD